MEPIYKINIRSTLNGMSLGSVFAFPKDKYRSTSIRSLASVLKEQEGKSFSISIKKEPGKITVTRIS